MKKGKKYLAASEKVDATKLYTIEEAVKLVKETSTVKFDATVDVSFKLNVDPRQADQQVRGTLVLPHGNGKTKTVKNQEKYVNDIYENFKEVVSEEGDTKTYSMSSFMVFFKDVYTFFTFKQGTDTAGTSFQGDYKSFKPGTDL